MSFLSTSWGCLMSKWRVMVRYEFYAYDEYEVERMLDACAVAADIDFWAERKGEV